MIPGAGSGAVHHGQHEESEDEAGGGEAGRGALELVRCKDCRNLEITGCYGECRKGYLGIVRPDDFCSRAEKRGGVR